MGRSPGRGAARALAVLAVLVGLLAMHGLGGTHHAAAAVPHSVADEAAGPHAPAVPVRVHPSAPEPLVAASGWASAPSPVTAGAAPGAPCGPDCDDVAVLCVAVLAGAGLLLVLAHLGSRPAGSRLGRPPSRPRAPPLPAPASPDPVKELCVSRT